MLCFSLPATFQKPIASSNDSSPQPVVIELRKESHKSKIGVKQRRLALPLHKDGMRALEWFRESVPYFSCYERRGDEEGPRLRGKEERWARRVCTAFVRDPGRVYGSESSFCFGSAFFSRRQASFYRSKTVLCSHIVPAISYTALEWRSIVQPPSVLFSFTSASASASVRFHFSTPIGTPISDRIAPYCLVAHDSDCFAIEH